MTTAGDSSIVVSTTGTVAAATLDVIAATSARRPASVTLNNRVIGNLGTATLSTQATNLAQVIRVDRLDSGLEHLGLPVRIFSFGVGRPERGLHHGHAAHYTQSASVFYSVVTSASVSSGYTVVNTAGNAFANTAITANAYVRPNPQGYPGAFSYIPALTASSTNPTQGTGGVFRTLTVPSRRRQHLHRLGGVSVRDERSERRLGYLLPLHPHRCLIHHHVQRQPLPGNWLGLLHRQHYLRRARPDRERRCNNRAALSDHWHHRQVDKHPDHHRCLCSGHLHRPVPHLSPITSTPVRSLMAAAEVIALLKADTSQFTELVERSPRPGGLPTSLG